VSIPLNFAKGSKRRLRQVRWTHRERISAAFLFLTMLAFGVFIALWMISHPFD